MALVSYRVETVVPEFITTFSAFQGRLSDEFRPAVVALADGGFAVAYLWEALDSASESVLVDFYNADGSRRFGNDFSVPDTFVSDAGIFYASAAQLSSGDLIVTWRDSNDPGIHYATLDPSSGDVVVEDTRLPGTDADDGAAQVVPLAGGGWALVKADYTAVSDIDSDLLIYNSAGVLQGDVHPLNGNDTRDEDWPAIAVLTAGRNKGNMAIAYTYEKVDGKDTLGLAIEIWNPAGQRVLSPFPFDLVGDANYDPAVVALKDGGFAVAYLDNEYGSSGYTVAFFDQDGSYRGKVRGDTGAAGDSELAITVLSNGYVYVTGTDNIGVGGSLDIRSGLFDPASIERVMSLGVVEIQSGAQSASSVTVLKNGTIVTAWTDRNAAIEDGNTDPDDSHVSMQIDQIVRKSTGDNTADTIVGDQLVDEMFGGFSGDTLRGEGGNDRLFGEAGADTLYGGAGADRMEGGADNDTYVVDNVGDVVVEALGGGIADRVLASVNYALKAGVEVETLGTNAPAGTAPIHLTGNALAQTINGNAGANMLNDGGGAAADTLRGLGGNDVYVVHNSGAVIVEAGGQGTDSVLTSVDYVLKNGISVETLGTTSATGTSAIDLTGNSIGQTLRGNAGSNVIDGKGGADTLTGFGGKDFFVFSSAIGASSDTVTDFNVTDDTIRLENAIFTKLTNTGALNTAFFRSNSTGTAVDGNDYVLYDNTDGKLYYDADGSGAGSKIHFATLTSAPAVTNLDFVVI